VQPKTTWLLSRRLSVEIKLTKGKVALVSEQDYHMLTQHKWSYDGRYARASIYYKDVRMHRLIMQAPLAQAAAKELEVEVDHINGDKLDNRRENLRLVTKSQNQHNKPSCNSRKYKGVSREKSRRKWKAQIHFNNKDLFLGHFDTDHEAARAYNAAARIHFGDHARFNIIGDE
jgi:hypothetical protein